mmetsp:Transcript_13412/g.25858  ORF Transcript_13412/g.25858 Transcript_13412/m.25858 type:complete len:334 (+) Transcript_13412:408-1409(+)
MASWWGELTHLQEEVKKNVILFLDLCTSEPLGNMRYRVLPTPVSTYFSFFNIVHEDAEGGTDAVDCQDLDDFMRGAGGESVGNGVPGICSVNTPYQCIIICIGRNSLFSKNSLKWNSFTEHSYPVLTQKSNFLLEESDDHFQAWSLCETDDPFQLQLYPLAQLADGNKFESRKNVDSTGEIEKVAIWIHERRTTAVWRRIVKDIGKAEDSYKTLINRVQSCLVEMSYGIALKDWDKYKKSHDNAKIHLKTFHDKDYGKSLFYATLQIQVQLEKPGTQKPHCPRVVIVNLRTRMDETSEFPRTDNDLHHPFGEPTFFCPAELLGLNFVCSECAS